MQREDTKVKVKTCTKCGESKPFSEFYKKKTGKYGLAADCKVCRNEYRKTYRQENKEKISEYKKAHYQENKEKVLARHKAYNQENKEKLKEKQKTYRRENKEKRNEYLRKKYNEDPLHRLKQNTRKRVREALKGSKSQSTSKILGCSYEQLHLRLGFENLTNPSLDHIIPLSWGKTEEEVLALNRWENIQGMEAEENFSKGNRYCTIAKANQVLKMHPNPKLISKILARAEKKGKNYVQNFGS